VRLTTSSGAVVIQPGAAGLTVDVAATMAGLTGFTLNPLRMWAHLTGAEDQPLLLRVDRGRLTAAVTRAAVALDRPVRQGSIAFPHGRATAVLPVTGTVVRVPETVDAVAAAWPRLQVVPAAVAMTRPTLTAAEITRAMTELAVPAMSAPVTVLAGAVTVILLPAEYGPALSTAPDGTGKLRLKVDMATLTAAIRAAGHGIESPPVDATVRLVGGTPQVVAAVAGTNLDGPASSAAFLAALTSRSRTVSVRLVPASPKVTTLTARGWQITEPISTFTTQFPVNPPRTNNIKMAVATLNDTLVRPGAQFSLNATLGKRTPAKGYQLRHEVARSE